MPVQVATGAGITLGHMFRTRQARREDHPELARVWHELGMDVPPLELDFWDEKFREHTIFLETQARELVAYALTLPYGARGDVRQIVVYPQWRGRGIGREIMAAVASKLRGQGCREMAP